MYLDLEPLQGKPWHEQIATLVNAAHRIAIEHQSPLKNDAKGTVDCYQLEDKLEDCRRILKRYHPESACHSERSEESR